MAEPSCETCIFWSTWSYGVATEDRIQSGECRRRSPKMILVQTPTLYLDMTTSQNEPEPDPEEMIRRVWPLTYAYDWCGEWQGKEQDGEDR